MFPTPRGVLLVLGAAPLIALGAWQPWLEWLAAGYLLLAAGLLYTDWRLAGDGRRFNLVRQHDSKLSLGADNSITLRLRSPDRLPVSFTIRDEPPEAFEVSTHLLHGQLLPRQEWCTAYAVRPLRRGDYQFGDLNLRWDGPLGLVTRQARLPAAGPVKVYPNLLDVRRYDLLLKRNRLQEMGLRSARHFGEGTEFERLREYSPDDEYRRIDWKATARRHRPVTIEYQTERSQSVFAVIDTGRMMQTPVAHMAKLDYVINAALLLTYVAAGKGDKVGLLTFAEEVTSYLSPAQGRGQFYRALETLYGVEAQPFEPNYARALSYLAHRHRKRALVVIFTDLSGGVSMHSLIAQASLLARSSLPLVVTISDPQVHAAAEQRPEDSLGVFQRAAAAHLLDERQVVLDSLNRQGVLTLDVPANQLSLSVINRYLELKAKTRL
jgi:uncharacterized protein (DUF58 family)